MLICEFSTGRGVEMTGNGASQLTRALRIARGAIKVAADFVEAREREECFDVGGIDSGGPSQTLDGVIRVALSFVKNSEHVVHVGIVDTMLRDSGEMLEGGGIIASIECTLTLNQAFAIAHGGGLKSQGGRRRSIPIRSRLLGRDLRLRVRIGTASDG